MAPTAPTESKVAPFTKSFLVRGSREIIFPPFYSIFLLPSGLSDSLDL